MSTLSGMEGWHITQSKVLISCVSVTVRRGKGGYPKLNKFCGYHLCEAPCLNVDACLLLWTLGGAPHAAEDGLLRLLYPHLRLVRALGPEMKKCESVIFKMGIN